MVVAVAIAVPTAVRVATADPAALIGAALVMALGRSLGVDDQLAPWVPLVEGALNGLQLQLLQGAAPAETEEAYHRFWVTALA